MIKSIRIIILSSDCRPGDAHFDGAEDRARLDRRTSISPAPLQRRQAQRAPAQVPGAIHVTRLGLRRYYNGEKIACL